ncbi:hypothetical protein [Oceanicola sp. 502str15]|uniref:hypothetical protein n=1 Tax=Oceanicola sp. 502str15 TaxID=2696061 RepID=UPI0020948B9E|nr:hypothetical protein [Oceanicola sp. 502str15]MCO6381569.1 hypothetical protein [Oceanicola sp. 502str15]
MGAREDLIAAFEGRAEAVVTGAVPLVGLFGDGCPEALIAGAGGRAVEVKAPPLGEIAHDPGIARVIEPFMDAFASHFLHRFAAGAFSNYAAILFCRDDVAALAAYQYALEMRRQGMVGPGPRLILWNLAHGTGEALHRFNMAEAERALQELHEALGPQADEDRMQAAMAAESLRQKACATLEGSASSASDNFIFRNAGRWLEPGHHAALLSTFEPSEPTRKPRAALIGTAADTPALHGLCDTLGLAVTDQSPYGRIWPGCHAGPANLSALLRKVAEEPLNIRTNPPARFNAALDAALSDCDLVIASVDSNDDSFGWEIPRLRRSLAVPLVDLGFRPFRPGPDWLSKARARIEEALQ